MDESKMKIKYSRGFNKPPLNKDKPNTVILLMGATCAGKTTVARELHKRLNNGNTTNELVRYRYHDFIEAHPEVNNEFMPTNSEVAFTLFDNTAHVGKLSYQGACSGTDLLFDVAEVKGTYLLAKQYRKFIIFDGMLTTVKWLDFIDDGNTKILPVLLDTGNLEINHYRLVERRNVRKSLPTDDTTLRTAAASLTPATKYNIYKKRNAFINCMKSMHSRVGSTIKVSTNTDISTTVGVILEALSDL